MGIVLLAAGAVAGEPVIRVVAERGDPVRLNVVLREASVRRAVAAVAMHLGRPVRVEAAEAPVSLELRGVAPETALRAIAASAGLEVAETAAGWSVRDPGELSVTLDVQDEDARAILREAASQCGIRNLMIDPDVAGSGTFRFREVPCSRALTTILRSLGLRGEMHGASVLRVQEP